MSPVLLTLPESVIEFQELCKINGFRRASDAARHLGVGNSTISTWYQTGRIPPIYLMYLRLRRDALRTQAVKPSIYRNKPYGRKL